MKRHVRLYRRSVWENLTASWVIPLTCTLGVGLGVLLISGRKHDLVYVWFRLDGIAVLLYYGFRWRKDLANLRRRREVASGVGSGSRESPAFGHNSTSPLFGVFLAVVILIMLTGFVYVA
jgi:hypothetical protein